MFEGGEGGERGERLGEEVRLGGGNVWGKIEATLGFNTSYPIENSL